PGLFNRMTLSSLMAYSLLSTGMDDLEDHPEYAAYLSPSSTTFEHNSTFQHAGLLAIVPGCHIPPSIQSLSIHDLVLSNQVIDGVKQVS
ncbi:hypothetical protein, partial [Methylocaldum sp.]|uniref:hypothetical protein n=1 Tax=Methylocaldum sp. TaxID=1969727 RepID=UPI002D3C567B